MTAPPIITMLAMTNANNMIRRMLSDRSESGGVRCLLLMPSTLARAGQTRKNLTLTPTGLSHVGAVTVGLAAALGIRSAGAYSCKQRQIAMTTKPVANQQQLIEALQRNYRAEME